MGGLAAPGCAIVGPAAMRGGRSVYNDAIVATNNEQVLAMIVRMRYGEPAGILAVSSVTANVRVQANAAAQFGVGPESSFEGSLVPLSAGVVYEENPTISYVPAQGAEYLRQLLSPLPIDLLVLLLGATRDSPQVLTLLVRSINAIQNPDFIEDPSVAADRRFARIAELLAALDRRGQLAWAQEPGEAPSFELVLRGEGEAYAQQVAELYALLGLRRPPGFEDVLTLPVRLGVGRHDEAAIQLQTRSMHDLFGIAAASVDVPREHLASGLAPPVPPAGPAGACIRVRRTRDRPGPALVAIEHHGWWYSIDSTDAASKLTFRVLESLLTARIADTIDRRSALPVLTVPVAR